MTGVILFTQETCRACATLREKNEGIGGEYPDVEFREVDTQKDLETAEEYGVRKTPTTLVYANGEQTAKFIVLCDDPFNERKNTYRSRRCPVIGSSTR